MLGVSDDLVSNTVRSTMTRVTFPKHVLFAFGGGLVSSGSTKGEIWQCGIRGTGPQDGWLADPDTYLEEVASGLSTWFGSAGAQLGVHANLEFLKVNNITPEGKYADLTTHQVDYQTPVNGGNTMNVPAFNCLAWSWTTVAKRGPGHTGRIYPPVALPSGQASTVPQSLQTACVAAAQDLLNIVINAGGTEELVPCVVSSVGSGSARNITGVRVGNVIDVQRRRKEQIPETYETGVFPTS